MELRTPITELLDIRYPIVLAPMGGVSGGALAQAVTAAGGLGLIATGYGDAEWIEHEFDAAGNARVGTGFITWNLARNPELLDLVLAREPAAVMLSFGDPAPFAAKIKGAGAKFICQVQTVRQAREAAQCGADIVVAQGAEAGGHGASRGSFALIPAVADAVRPIPVLAAGGIADGRGLAAALMLGAAGVLVGTRFYATPEALGLDAAKERITQATGDETARTTVFDLVRGHDWPNVYTGRAVRNDFLERWHGHEDELAENVERERERYKRAVREGDAAATVVFAGEAVDLIHELEPAGQIVERIVREALERLAQKPS